MPTVSIHEEVAYNIAQKYKNLDTKDFYLGVLAPDAVNLHGFAKKELRWKSHLRDEDLSKWLNNVKKFYQENKYKYNKNFLLGYILHIITDIVHDKYFYLSIMEKMTEDNIQLQHQHSILRKCMEEYGYQNENEPFRIYIKDLLKDTNSYSIQGISKKKLVLWKNHCLINHIVPKKTNKYITKEHIIELTNKTEEVFKAFLI